MRPRGPCRCRDRRGGAVRRDRRWHGGVLGRQRSLGYRLEAPAGGPARFRARVQPRRIRWLTVTEIGAFGDPRSWSGSEVTVPWPTVNGGGASRRNLDRTVDSRDCGPQWRHRQPSTRCRASAVWLTVTEIGAFGDSGSSRRSEVTAPWPTVTGSGAFRRNRDRTVDSRDCGPRGGASSTTAGPTPRAPAPRQASTALARPRG